MLISWLVQGQRLSQGKICHEPSAELIAILTVYFVQGILGLARPVSFFPKDELVESMCLFVWHCCPTLDYYCQCLALCPGLPLSATDGVHTWFCQLLGAISG